jgi:hypothetical protein
MTDHLSDEISGGPRLPGRSRVIAWATLAAVGAAVAAGGIYAATTGGSPSLGGSIADAQAAAATSASPSPSAKAPGKDGRRGPGGPGMAGGFGGFGGGGGFAFGPMGSGRVLHGESTVATPSGGTEIIDTQSGTISAIDASAKTITVTSTDKVAFSYVVDTKTRLVDFAAATPAKATFADLKVNDKVSISAVRTGDTRTATSVIDGAPTPRKPATTGTASPGATAQPWGKQGGRFGPRGPRPSASPSPNATAASA